MSPDTVQARDPVRTKCTECREHKAQCPKCSLGTGPTPNYLEQEAVATAGMHAGNHGPLPQCLPGTTLRPGACWGRAATSSAPRHAFRPAGIGTKRLTWAARSPW